MGTKRSAPAAEGISINLGVKRITIQDSVGEMLQTEKSRTSVENQHLRKSATFGQTELPRMNTIIAFSIFTLMAFLILTFGASMPRAVDLFLTLLEKCKYLLR